MPTSGIVKIYSILCIQSIMFSFLSRRIKIKNIKLATFVFSSLFVLSFAVFSFADDSNTLQKNIFQDTDQDGLSNDEEKLYGTNPNKADTDGDGYSDGTEVKSGYDPMKAAPGDRLGIFGDSEENISITGQANTSEKKDNLTEEVSKQVAMKLKESASKKENLSLDELRDTVQKTMSEKITVDTLPEIDVKTIKIKKQKYSNLSEEDRAAKIKEDVLEYSTAVSYILVNNSPIPMQSDGDMSKLASFITSNAMGVLSGNNSALLDDFSKKGTLITEQLQDVQVPENMLDMHVKALKLAQYTTTFKESIQSSGADDPLAQINTLAKVQGFVGLFSGFAEEMNTKLTEYGIELAV